MPGRAVDCSTGLRTVRKLAACKTLDIPSKQVGRDALQQATPLVACEGCICIDSRQRETRSRLRNSRGRLETLLPVPSREAAAALDAGAARDEHGPGLVRLRRPR